MTWSEWKAPKHNGYRFVCCDCGLVHEMEFRVFKIVNEEQDGRLQVKTVDGFGVEFRARRDDEETERERSETVRGA